MIPKPAKVFLGDFNRNAAILRLASLGGLKRGSAAGYSRQFYILSVHCTIAQGIISSFLRHPATSCPFHRSANTAPFAKSSFSPVKIHLCFNLTSLCSMSKSEVFRSLALLGQRCSDSTEYFFSLGLQLSCASSKSLLANSMPGTVRALSHSWFLLRS